MIKKNSMHEFCSKTSIQRLLSSMDTFVKLLEQLLKLHSQTCTQIDT